MTPGQEANGDNLGPFFRASRCMLSVHLWDHRTLYEIRVVRATGG